MQSRVTDHRAPGLAVHDIAGFMAGEHLAAFAEALADVEREEALAALEAEAGAGGDGAGGGRA
jgi:protein subunit release factor A